MAEKDIRMQDAIQVVRRIAGKMRIPAHLFEDAVGDGLLGVAEARNKFDPDKGVAFWTYASAYARGYIQHGLRRKSLGCLETIEEYGRCDSHEETVLLHEAAREAAKIDMGDDNGLDVLEFYLTFGTMETAECFKVHPNAVRKFMTKLAERMGFEGKTAGCRV